MIKLIKSGLLIALLFVAALSTHADRLYVQDTNVQAGEECDLNIVLESSDMSQYCAFQFDLIIPDGLETGKDKIFKYNNYYTDPEQSFSIEQISKGKWRVVCASATNQRMKGQTGAIMLFRVTASASLPVGDLQGSIQNIVFTKLLADGTTQTVRMDASTYTISVWKEASLAFDPVSKTYGDAAFTVSPKTNVSGGAITYSSGNTGVVKVSGQTFTIVGTGTAVITANQAATTNYSATSATFTVTVAQREAVLSWSNLSFTYDGKSHVPTATVTNLVGNDVCNVTVTGAQTNVGTHTATATALSNANYKLPDANTQTFTIISVSSELTFDPVNKTYGDTPFSVAPKTNVSGGAITYTSGNTAVVKVNGSTFTIVGAGTAVITANQAATAGYSATSTTFTVTVAQREAVLSWSNLSFTYDGKSHVPTATVQNLVGSDACSVTVTGAQTNAGNYTATAMALSSANYKLPAANTKGFSIAKVPLTIFAGNYVMKQGDPMPQWKAEYNGFVNGETESVLTKQPDFSCDANENSAPGIYTVTVSGAEAQNYDISYQNGTLTVAAADQIVVTARSYSREYGDANPDFKYDVTGGTIQGEPQIICNAVPKSPVNNYPIILRPGTVTTPNVSYVDGWLTVNKAPLTITAKSYTIKQGDPMPKFEAEYSGFKLNETESVLTKQPDFSCAAFDSSEPGDYIITVYGYEAKNYDITPVDGSLKILPADPIIVTIENYSREYGDPNPSKWNYSVSGGALDGTPAITCDAKIDSPVGTYEIKGSLGTVTNPNVQFVSGYLTITKAPLKIIADSYTINQGDPLPTFTAHYETFKLGETESVLIKLPQFSCAAFDSSEPGTFPIMAYGAEAQNYAIDYVDNLLTILAVEENGYTLVVELTNGQKELFVLKDRPQAWPQGSQLHIQSATVSTAYERENIKRFYFLDKDGNESGVKAAEMTSELVVKQLSDNGLRISGLHDGETVRVYDLSGRILLTEKAQDGSMELSLAQYPKGVYIVNINNRRTIKIQVK